MTERPRIKLKSLCAAMKEKLVTASNTEKLQILTLVPDSWSRKYLIQSARELKQRKCLLAQLSQEKGKAMAQETLILFMLSMRMMIQQTASQEKGISKHTERRSQTKAVSSVQSP